MTDIAPGGAGASRTPLVTPDPDLLAKVAQEIDDGVDPWFIPGTEYDDHNDVVSSPVALNALAATGEGLRDRLRERAAEYQRGIDNAGGSDLKAVDLRRWIVSEMVYREAADLVARLCGVAPEGSAGG